MNKDHKHWTRTSFQDTPCQRTCSCIRDSTTLSIERQPGTHYDHRKKRTIAFPLGQYLCQVDVDFANEIGFSGILSVTCEFQDLATFDFRWRSAVLGWWWWRGAVVIDRRVVHLLMQIEPQFIVPFRVLPALFDGPCTLFLTAHTQSTVRILLSYMSFIWKMILQ